MFGGTRMFLYNVSYKSSTAVLHVQSNIAFCHSRKSSVPLNYYYLSDR